MTDYLLIAITALMLADSALTVYGLERGAGELNPVTQWFIERLGNVAGVLAQRGAVLAVVWYVAPAAPEWVLWATAAVAALPVIWNLRILVRQR